ncbi:MAG: FAD-dependent oxidoreductase [Magnetococcales bacterium]|nr:FAD-dependent oxidoreductase [Magnetococcales bacterium]
MGETADYLIVGGGVMGLTLALEARRRHPERRVTLLEKEAATGQHASGRNSGVLHAGFYYTADSLKARFCREGNAAMTRYCLERGLRINRCGKLVVARREEDLPTLKELLRRGVVNGVELEDLSIDQARKLEPRVRSVDRVLYAPTTASVDPKEVMAALTADARVAGVELHLGAALNDWREGVAFTTRGTFSAGYLINAAGLYADRIARQCGFGKLCTLLPFKGVYLYGDEPAGAFAMHIYPVPDLANPFLGVHTTLTVDGRVKIGPTAMPAFWREHYQGFAGFRWGEFQEIIRREAGLFLRNDFGFRQLALRELRKYRRREMVRQAGLLATGIEAGRYRHWGPPGVRAQLLDTRDNRLETDFRLEGDQRSFHLLNTVSPGFTCAMPFARHVFDQIDALTG